MKQPEKFLQLQQELSIYIKPLGQAADTIVEQEVSEYPIFIAHHHIVDIGIALFDKEKNKGGWSINASSLEELVTKQIITPDRIEEFKNTYKDPNDYVCFFVLSELGAKFIFLPRK